MTHPALASEALRGKVVASDEFRGDVRLRVDASDWTAVAELLRDDPKLAFDHFIDLTAVDYPERAPTVPRFDVVLLLRSSATNARLQVKTRVGDDQPLPTLTGVWSGTNWAEREIFDMFGIRFDGHPDLRRILMYEEFEGYPLRKDYPIERTQPLVPYRDADGVGKLFPFGLDEGQPFGRIDWTARLEGRDHQVSPAIARQTGQRKMAVHYDDVDPIRQEPPPTAVADRDEPAQEEQG